MKDGTWMMKMSATAYFLSFVIKNQFAVDCRFCSQNFSFYTSTKTKYAQVMSKLWLSKNRTQHSNQIVWFSIGMQEKRGEEEKNDNDSASTMWWLVWHIFLFVALLIYSWITRCHPTYVCNDLFFFFSFWLLLLCALLCVRVLSI